VEILIAAGEIVAGLALVFALAAIVGIAVVVILEEAARLASWARRRHRRHAHPITRAARSRHLTPCRCPDAPCRVHPFAFDVERLLSPGAKPW
jgi:hypothetical protein